jgi:hypothetical protein
MLVNDFRKVTVFAGMFGAFLGCIGVKFGAFGGNVFIEAFRLFFVEGGFDGHAVFRSSDFFGLGGVFIGEIGFGGGVNFFGLFFFVVHVEFSATYVGIHFGVRGGFFVFGLNEFGGEGGGLIFAQIGVVADGLGGSGGGEFRFMYLR